MPRLIDSHTHHYLASHLGELSWMTASSPLNGQFSPAELSAASAASPPDGYIFVETDRAYPSLQNLQYPLNEISFALSLRRQPGLRLVGMVPFAPVPLGREEMEAWWAAAKALGAEGEVEEMVKGVRYLVQDKPAGTMAGMVEGVRWALERGLAFDLGVDFHRRGREQLVEAVAMLEKVFEGGEERGWVVLDHLGKPNLTSPAHWDGSFSTWSGALAEIAAFPRVAVKFSGVFSELDKEVDDVVERVFPWVKEVFGHFGAERVMWGSDWPVCEIGHGEMKGKERQQEAWAAWKEVSEKLLEKLVEEGVITEAQMADVWGEVAARVYGL
ncbi:amidohydrolase family protein [Sphaerosporella brunnea]|uniref:Amidohydrolase family protein n=1 Tax=Sphaerosporella brunnea TaxID=1250544 RepID=A0A5J5EST0_9PEZI|nr:amidohydrolase family protein [Sphaerosporella brunnea]